MAPVMLGACSFFFWVATKVHTHNALFIYCEPFSGGGKIFYYWNRVVFATLYCSILIFFGILAIKVSRLNSITGYYNMQSFNPISTIDQFNIKGILQDGYSFYCDVSNLVCVGTLIFIQSLISHLWFVSLLAFSMLLVTIMVDKSITNTFVVNSLNLPIKIARKHDDEEASWYLRRYSFTCNNLI